TQPKDLTPQPIGSATTYLRRYSLAAITGLASEDDDGAAGTGTTDKRADSHDKAVRRPPGTLSRKEIPPQHDLVNAALEQAGREAFGGEPARQENPADLVSRFAWYKSRIA